MKLGKPTFIISTRSDDLVEALKKSPKIITVWVRAGKFKDKLPIIRSAIVYEARSITDAKDYQKRFISVLPVPNTHTKLSILKGISKRQIAQLLIYTRKDKLIRTQTHDFDHFKSKKTFLSWKSRGKTIYTLINRTGKLLGVKWYDKRHPGKHIEPTVRIYPPIRGMRFTKKFLEIVRQNYKPKSRRSVIPKNRKSKIL
ncbi:MAG: hypothetical protein NT162_03065 [Candidatus Woesebacteria bacterium]|nr:hypothetical protein [Candidatus Woesebacteria bacterium]